MSTKRLSEIMTPGVIGVSPETSVSNALDILRNKNISCVLVLENREPVGIFTERKVVQLAARHGSDFKDYSISDIMTSPVLTADRDMDIYAAYNLLSTNKIRHLVVVDEHKKLCGVVTQSNMMDHLGYEYFIDFKKISQVMTRNIFTVAKNYSVVQALNEMARISTSCLVVTENSRPIGIVTERDMTRMLIDGINIKTLTTEEIMSHPVHTVSLNLPLLEAARIMKDNKIRRLVAVDEEGKITGLATQSDIIKGLHGQYLQNLKHLVVEKDRELEQTSRKLAEKTVYLDNILHSSIDMGMVAADLDYHIIYFNPAAENILGLPATEVVGRDIREVHRNHGIEPEHFEKLADLIQDRGKYEFFFEQKGRFVKALVNGIWNQEKKLVGFVLMLQDVTERTLAEREIKKQKTDLELMNAELTALYSVSSKISRTLDMSTLLSDVLEALTTIAIFSFEHQGAVYIIDEDEIELVSQVGLPQDRLENQKRLKLKGSVYGRAVEKGEIIIIDGKEVERAKLSFGNKTAGAFGAIIVPLNAKGKAVGVLCLCTPPDFQGMEEDSIELLSAIGNQIGIAIENAKLYEKTKFLSLYDPLTNVANRRFMDIGLEKCFLSAKRYAKPFSLIMLDVDDFKKYNDTHGHSEGDKMLAKVARVLLEDIRNADAVARYGGEEFLVMLPETPLEEANITAERIRENIEKQCGTTISLGVASHDPAMEKKEDLINKADEALYRAKRKGKNRVEN